MDCKECEFANPGKRCADPIVWVNSEGEEVCRYQEGATMIEKAEAKGSTELALLADNERLTKWLEWIAAHSVTETEIPGEDYPCCNMPPNEGADAALRGQSIEEYDES